jgi:predicted amidophosphoribosyltransferase
MEVVIALALLAILAVGLLAWWRRELRVCDVCGASVARDAATCPKCGADFTNSAREYHSLD